MPPLSKLDPTPFVNDIGQKIEVNDVVAFVTKGYGRSTKVTVGRFAGTSPSGRPSIWIYSGKDVTRTSLQLGMLFKVDPVTVKKRVPPPQE